MHDTGEEDLDDNQSLSHNNIISIDEEDDDGDNSHNGDEGTSREAQPPNRPVETRPKLLVFILFHALFIQYLETNYIANQTPGTTIAIFLPFVIDFANTPTIRSIEGLETAVNHGAEVVKQAIILPFVINPADIPRNAASGFRLRALRPRAF